jgi:hypothetical protein
MITIARKLLRGTLTREDTLNLLALYKLNKLIGRNRGTNVEPACSFRIFGARGGDALTQRAGLKGLR